MVVTHTSSHVFSNSTLVQILDDLCVRFIINLPTEEMHSVERVCFQIEEAQWYYEDFVRGHNPNLPTLNLRTFASKIFQHCPSLHEWKDSHEQAMNQFIEYKSRVPVRGAILLNPELDQCVLVRGMKASASWSFPRGKINQDEEDDVCAVREVLEETGFDASHFINSDWYIEQSIRSQSIRLYIIPGVPLDTQFAPRTRNEIGTIQWHYLADLPTFSKRKANGEAPKMGKFYMVAPFLPPLRKWIQKDGSQWKLEQSAHAVDVPLPTDDEHYEQKEQDGVNLLTTYPHTEPTSAYQDSSASLRSLLGIHAESAPDPVASQADAAAKLKSLLSIGPNSEPSQSSSISTNGQLLLSLLQNGRSAKKADPSTQANPTAQPPVTSTPGAIVPVASPHSTVSVRKPLTPSHNVPVAQPPALYPSPNYKSSQTTSPYSHVPGPTNALLAELQSSTKPAPMNDQAAALLKTLNSNNLPHKQQAVPTPSSSDVHIPIPHQAQTAADTQQKLSLLSILKGPSTAAPVQQVNTVPITPVSPVVQPHVPQHQPPHQTPLRHQTPPTTAIAKNSAGSPANRSPAARREYQHKNSPTSPRNHRANNRSIRNVDFPKPTPATRPLPGASVKEAPPALQVPQKRVTPPLEPYLNSPVTRSAGVSLNAVSPVLARTDPMFDRRETANQEQQQTLLALFKKPSVSALKSDPKSATAVAPSVSSPTESNASASAKLLAAVKKVQSQQVPSMKTGGGVSLSQARSDGAASSPRSSLAPGGAVAFAKDAFLMSYLEGVAKGAGK